MASLIEKHDKLMKLANITFDELVGIADDAEKEDIEIGYEQTCGLVKKLENSIEMVKDQLLDEDKTLETITAWSHKEKAGVKPIRDLRNRMKAILAEMQKEETHQEIEREMAKQRALNERSMQTRIDEQREIEAASIRQIEREKEWLKEKLQLEREAEELKQASGMGAVSPAVHHAVKLQKYTITPFDGDYKDWIRFWNQFQVEVDGASISEISKFHYLMELTKGKPRQDILGLPHSVDGYEEAKKILVSTYGKDSKVHKALIKEIENLHQITNIHKTASIHEFYNKLSRTVRTLATLKKLDSAQSTVYTLLDKLGPVREILAQADDDWEEWQLEDISENLRKYVERNPLMSGEDIDRSFGNRERSQPRDKMLLGNGQRSRRNFGGCVYCGNGQHKSVDCTTVLSIASRREILKSKKLCYNCTGAGHSASNCYSRCCTKCGQKHHTSICEKQETTVPTQDSEKNMSASSRETRTIHATLMAKVNGQEARIMIDTGASSSYVCSDLISKLSLKPARTETRCIEQMYGTVTRQVEIYNVNIKSLVRDDFNFDVNCINAEKGVLTYLPNPEVRKLKQRFRRLKRLEFSDEATTAKQLPIHVILGAADYQRIRTTEQPVLGDNPDCDPGAEFTMLGWMLYGRLGSDSSAAEKSFFLNSSKSEFERLCSLDILGLEEPGHEQEFHESFTSNLLKSKENFYETRLPWKTDRMSLPNNKALAEKRLLNTTRRLQKIGKLADYDDIMQEQIKEGVLEKTPDAPTGEVVHYIPHQPVFREGAETTKLRIVYDCSAKQSEYQPSLNDCLETGPSLQPLLFDIILRNRMKRYCIMGDIKKAFLQIRIDEADRDAQRIMWYNNLEERKPAEYRFTRVIFGAASSPYILGATLQKHVSDYLTKYPETAKALLLDTYVDDIQYGTDSLQELETFKVESTEIMNEGGFTLHKWHSNVSALETGHAQNKEQLLNQEDSQNTTTKILGIPWNKTEDTVAVDFSPHSETNGPITKRKVLASINRVYDLHGWVAPVMITAKILFSELCLRKVTWDEPVPEDLSKRWNQWIKGLKNCDHITIPRYVADNGINEFIIHGFADASKLAICAAVYVSVKNSDGTASQNLLVSKSRIAPKDTSIPRLELFAAHMLAKLVSHVKGALSTYPIQECHMWSDSMTVLYWLASKGTWSVYVRNRVRAIQDLGKWVWHHVPTKENPSDLGTRGIPPAKLDKFWLKGPDWLINEEFWPHQPEITQTEEAVNEIIPKQTEKTLLATANEVNTEQQEWTNGILQKYGYWKLCRITAWMKRFTDNCRLEHKLCGPLSADEITTAENAWIKMAQEIQDKTCSFDLKQDQTGVWRCEGRVPGYNPIYISRHQLLATRIVEHYHRLTLHGGVQATMAALRQKYWIPRLRQMVKSVCHKCNSCRKRRAKGMPALKMASLPTFRVEFTDPFATTGVDYAGPFYCKSSNKETMKVYVLLFTCASTRAVHLKACKDMTTTEFKRSLKEFVARRGKPQRIVSDNAKTFIAAKKWLNSLKQDEDVGNYLASQSINWTFNMSRAPWWGGFFERLVGMMKSALAKAIGKAFLTLPEFEETLLDVECFMNNRPLTYLGEDFERPAITPNTLLRGQPATNLGEQMPSSDEQTVVARRVKYMNRCRLQLRKRFIEEYLKALEERKRPAGSAQIYVPNGSVVLIKDTLKQKSQWRIGRVEGRITGRDGITRGYKIRTGTGYIVERPVQLISNLEIGGEIVNEDQDLSSNRLNATAAEFAPRRGACRGAKEDALNRITGIQLNEDEEL